MAGEFTEGQDVLPLVIVAVAILLLVVALL